MQQMEMFYQNILVTLHNHENVRLANDDNHDRGAVLGGWGGGLYLHRLVMVRLMSGSVLKSFSYGTSHVW